MFRSDFYETNSLLKPLENCRKLDEFYKERENRLKTLHDEELEELHLRLRQANDRLMTTKADHDEELERERDKRLRDLAKQSEEHQITVDNLRAEYIAALDKFKELKSYELDSTKDAKDVSK